MCIADNSRPTRPLPSGATHSPDGSPYSTRLVGSASHRPNQVSLHSVRRTPRTDRRIPRDWWGVRRTGPTRFLSIRCDALPGRNAVFHATGGECVAPARPNFSPFGATHSPDGSPDSTRLVGSASHRPNQISLHSVRRTPRTDRRIPYGLRGVRCTGYIVPNKSVC